MSQSMLGEFFVEDNARQQLIVPLVERVSKEEGIDFPFRVRIARGGHARAMQSFEHYQFLRTKGLIGNEVPALPIVAIDGNCSSFKETSRDIRRATRRPFEHMLVTACPDPHIERWYLADPESLQTVVGTHPKVSCRKCTSDQYRQILSEAVVSGGHPPTLGGGEFSTELAEAMDLYGASKNDSALSAFVRNLGEGLRRASRTM